MHHLGGVVWCGGDAKKLLPLGHRGIVYGLDVDAVACHHDVAQLRVLGCVRHLPQEVGFPHVRTKRQAGPSVFETGQSGGKPFLPS